MGCTHSAPELVDTVTTADELSRRSMNLSTGEECQEPAGPLNVSLEHPNVLPDGTAAASSSEALARPGQDSPCHRYQPNGASATSQPAVISAVFQNSSPISIDTTDVGRVQPNGPTGTAEVAVSDESNKTSGRIFQALVHVPGQTYAFSEATEGGGKQPIGSSSAALVPTLLPADNRKLVLIVWDIENVRCPRDNGCWDFVLTPEKVLRYVKEHFIYEPGRMEYRTVAAVTPKSLTIIQEKHPKFVEQVVPELTLLVASAEEPKRNADVMLKKELYRFISEHAHIARYRPGQLTVVLLSGDEDFLEPVQVALNSGFAVELMHHDKPSWALRGQQGYARPPSLWSEFLKQRSGATHVNLPYTQKKRSR